jgi:hypothetical protein
MKWMTLIGLILAAAGVLALIYEGIPYTSWQKEIQIGGLEAKAKREKVIPLSPVLGVAALAGGIVLVFIGARK